MKSIFILFTLLFAISCTTQKKSASYEVSTIDIAHYQVPCIGGQSPKFCYLIRKVKQGKEGNWEYFYGNIKGLENYEWGKQYRIKVQQVIQDTTMQAIDIEDLYELLEITEEKSVMTDTFSINLKLDMDLSFISQEADSTYLLLGELPIKEGTIPLETELEFAIQNWNSIKGTFTLGQEDNSYLILHSLDSIK